MILSFEIKRGETGKIMPFTLFVQGSAFDLTGWTVTLTTKKDGEIFIANASCTIDPDQTTNPGKGSFTFTGPDANHPAGKYRMEFKLTDGTNILYFPCDAEDPYAELVVIEPLQ
jgi:hypothetical protein